MVDNRETVYKKDLIALHAKNKNISKTEAEERINEVLALITEAIFSDKHVKVSNFFNFFIRDRKAKPAKNPVTNEPMVIPDTITIVAKMTKPVKDRIQGKK